MHPTRPIRNVAAARSESRHEDFGRLLLAYDIHARDKRALSPPLGQVDTPDSAESRAESFQGLSRSLCLAGGLITYGRATVLALDTL